MTSSKPSAPTLARRMNAEWDRYDIGDLKDPPDHLMGRDAWGKAERDLASVNPQFVKAGQMLDAFTKTTLEWKYENGFLTEAQFDDFRTATAMPRCKSHLR